MTPGNTMLLSAEDTGPADLPHGITTPATLALLFLFALLAAWSLRQQLRKPRDGTHAGSTAVRVAAVAAVGCTAYSADTSWRFAADYLDMGGTLERATMFATAELALLATALLARQNLNGPKQAPGLPGTLTWVITAVQILPAYAESGPIGGTVRAFVGPVMAAMLWHLAMGIELRHRTPHADSHSLTVVLARQARERLLARLAITDRDADAVRITRERALDQAVTLILRAEAMTPTQRAKRRGRRLNRRLHQALERADVDRDAHQDELLLRKLATRQQALTLASITLPPRWPGPTTIGLAGGTAAAHPRVETGQRAEGPGGPPTEVAGYDAAERAARPSPGNRPQPPSHITTSPDPNPGEESPSADGDRTTRAMPQRPGPKPRATRDLLTDYAHRLHRENGRLSRDLLEDTVRADGYRVGSDIAGEVVRAVKTELTAAHADHAH